MQRAWPCLIVLVAAGCGGTVGDTHPRPPADRPALSADGIGLDLPDGWTGRILLGAAGTPVLHAATLPVEANDTDEGELAKEALGINGMYLNVRDLGPGSTGASLPAQFDAKDFDTAPAGFDHLRQASRVVESDGERFRLVAVSGGDGPPQSHDLDQLNQALASLRLAVYHPQSVRAATGNAVDGFGLHVNVPDGWQGGIARGEIHAGDGAIDLEITEYHSPDSASFVTGHMPIQLGPAEFVQPQGGTGYETGRSFVDAGREFQLWARSQEPHPDPASLERANAFLASFRAEPGDFYPGQVEPATFAPADGWDTGSTGPADIQPDGQQTRSWASTTPYRDSGFQFPPHETLDALPPDGIVILVTLEQHGQAHGEPATSPPFRLTDFLDGSFEGISPENGTKHFDALLANYSAGMWVLFGRAHPTQDQLDRAQAELDRLRLPDWPKWATSAER
jgi:hypothetical protein